MRKNTDTSTKNRAAQIVVLLLLIPAIFLGSLALGTSKEASAAEHNAEPTIDCDNGGRADDLEKIEAWGEDWHIPAWLQHHADSGCFDERITVTVEEAQLPYCIELNLQLEIQPRKSAESKQILGANRARLEFTDFLVIPEATRWKFRNRLYPTLSGSGAAGSPSAGSELAEDQGGDLGTNSGLSGR